MAHALEINENTKGDKGKSVESERKGDKRLSGKNDQRTRQEKAALGDSKKD
jgi:hypothetical protein